VSNPTIKKFTASDGYPLHYRHWQVSGGKPLGYVVGLHGIQSHSGWYEYSSSLLCEAGYDVRFLDRRGSGLNESSRGHTPHYERLMSDVVQFLTEVRHQRKQEAVESPVILQAVSWGGKLAVALVAKRTELVDALALLYPGICAKVRPTRWQQFLLRLAQVFEKGNKLVPIPLDDPKLFAREPQWQQFIRDDSLRLQQATVSLLDASVQLDRLTQEAAGKISCPVLLMLAGEDRIIDNDATRQYFARLASSNRKLIEYPQAAHTLEFEPNRDQIFQDLIDWLDSIRPPR